MSKILAKTETLLSDNYQELVFFLSFMATSGSLFFSEVIAIPVCNLCWYQRILMYPLVILTGVAMFTSEKFSPKYILSMTIPGALIAGYHYYLQIFNPETQLGSCGISIPCSQRQVELLGFITIPLMSLFAFALISIVVLLRVRKSGLK